VNGVTITSATNTLTNLLVAKDDPDETIVTDGTLIAECEAGSRIVKMNLRVKFTGLNTTTAYKVAFVRNPRNILTQNNILDNLMVYPNDAINKTMHENLASWKVDVADGTDRATEPFKVRLPRRLRFMNDTDRLALAYNVTTGGTAKIFVFGTITWLKP